MTKRTVITAVLLALAVAGCATEESPQIAAPQETVTVTETVTETVSAPAEDPSPTVADTASETAEPPPAATPASVCDEVADGEGESLAFVFVETPTSGSEVTSGFEVSGCANAFEATYEWELLDRGGSELAAGFGTASCGTGCVGEFSFTVDYTVGEVQVGALRVFTRSAEDGSVQDLNSIPLRLTP